MPRITPDVMLEEALVDLKRAEGRTQTALAHVKLEKRSRLAEAIKAQNKEESTQVSISPEAIKQFIITSIVPVIVGALVTWLSSTEVLSIFNISTTTAAGAITAVVVFGVSAGITWLSSHHILSGTYSPAAKAKAGS